MYVYWHRPKRITFKSTQRRDDRASFWMFIEVCIFRLRQHKAIRTGARDLQLVIVFMCLSQSEIGSLYGHVRPSPLATRYQGTTRGRRYFGGCVEGARCTRLAGGPCTKRCQHQIAFLRDHFLNNTSHSLLDWDDGFVHSSHRSLSLFLPVARLNWPAIVLYKQIKSASEIRINNHYYLLPLFAIGLVFP